MLQLSKGAKKKKVIYFAPVLSLSAGPNHKLKTIQYTNSNLTNNTIYTFVGAPAWAFLHNKS